MFLGDFVKYRGEIYVITSTYDDGTVDLDSNINVERNEVESL